MKKRKGLKITLFSVAALLLSVAFVLYGPWPGFRNFWITSAMTTYSRQWLATGLYSDETIQKVLSSNYMEEIKSNTDLSLININPQNKNKDIEIIKIKGSTFSGKLIKVYDPSWVHLVLPKVIGEGEKLNVMLERENAVCAINASGFFDTDGHSEGGAPLGLVIKDGKVVSDNNFLGHLVAITNDNKLLLGRYKREDIEKLDIRDAIEFMPFLIVNSQPSKIVGNGGWGLAPRTALGQCADGTFLFFVADGRSLMSIGASMKDVQDVMLEHGAVNAVNLDGGSTSIMMAHGKVINTPCTSATGRYLPNAFAAIKN